MTHYERLGLPRSASTAEIYAAFQRELRRALAQDDLAAAELLRRAFDVLTDPAARAAYDQRPRPLGEVLGQAKVELTELLEVAQGVARRTEAAVEAAVVLVHRMRRLFRR